jgi:hypothetical protein
MHKEEESGGMVDKGGLLGGLSERLWEGRECDRERGR